MNKFFIVIFIFALSMVSCTTDGGLDAYRVQDNRIFNSSFESVSEFDHFYIVLKGEYDSDHELSTELIHDGEYSHKAWIVEARSDTNDGLPYLPHRAYPTIQLFKTASGPFVTPCLISFWVYLDMVLQDRSVGSIDDWFSFATLSPDDSDDWTRTVLVNIAPDGYLRLVHVPNQGEQKHVYQVDRQNDVGGSLLYPYREWVKIDIYIDFSPEYGYAKVWQNGILVSHAQVNGGEGALEQAHFGLYASAAVGSGVIYNDNLSIIEVLDEEQIPGLFTR